ncbi:MAG: ornithine carbamoyltransferase [Mucinivorans sp.]
MRHLLAIAPLKKAEIEHLIILAQELKADKKQGRELKTLCGKNFALIFEKDSTRTRCAFEVAAADQGAFTTYIGSQGSQINVKESVKDSARVLGRMYDGIEYRGYGQQIVEQLATYSGVPVWNGLTNEAHPTQFLADLLTIKEHCSKPLEQIKVCFMGTADNNVALSLMVGCAKMGMHYSAATPESYFPASELVEQLRKDGAQITITTDVAKAVSGADFIYTDVWVSMGEPKELWKERIELLTPYQVNAKVMELTGNKNCKFLHCLPAFHDTETKVAKDILDQFGLSEMEVTNEVFESPASVVFDQAENRLHTIKAAMVASFQ